MKGGEGNRKYWDIVSVDAASFLSETTNMRVASAHSERKTEMCTSDGETKLKISTKALDI